MLLTPHAYYKALVLDAQRWGQRKRQGDPQGGLHSKHRQMVASGYGGLSFTCTPPIPNILRREYDGDDDWNWNYGPPNRWNTGERRRRARMRPINRRYG